MSTQMYKRSPEAIFSEVGEDVVALHVERGHCFGMEKVTAAVWNLLAEPRSVDQLCEALLATYEVGPETCRADVGRLLALLEGEGLVEPVAPAQ